MRKLLLMVLLVGCAHPAHAIEAYTAQEIQPYQAGEVKPDRAARKVKRVRAKEVKPSTAEEVKPYAAEEIRQDQGGDVAPSRGGSESGQGVTIEHIRPLPEAPTTSPTPAPGPKKAPAKQTKGAKALVGVWQTNIPGAVYTTPSGLTGYDILHVSSGAAAGLLRINGDGTYSWNSYGGKKGKWVETTDSEYPLEIIDTVENRRWRVGYSSTKGALIIWSGSIWYEGRRAEVKKK